MATITTPITITMEDSDLQKELSSIAEALENVDPSVSLGRDRKWRRLEDKRRRGKTKRMRRPIPPPED